MFRKNKKIASGFTLIELLVVVGIIGILASGIFVVLDPAGKMKQARDVRRKQDIVAIAKALEEYGIYNGNYPPDLSGCDSSMGYNSTACNLNTSGDWDNNSALRGLVSGGYLKKLPVDPTNKDPYFYHYEPYASGGVDYWVGVRLEKPSTGYKLFRCTNSTDSYFEGAGCKEVTDWNK